MGVDENFPPNFHVVNKDEEGNKVYDGSVYRYYMALGNMLNLTWKFLPNRFGSGWSFSSYVKDLNESHIDLIGSGWRCTN